MRITYDMAEQKVSELNNVFWDGYNIVVFNPKADGYFRPDGIYRDDTWGVGYTIYLTENGDWVIPRKYERLFK